MAITIAAILLTIYVVAGIALYVAQRTLIFQQDRTRESPAAVGLPDAEVQHIKAADGVDLEAWLIRGPATRLTLYFHGNGGALPWRAERIRELTEFGGAVLAVEYRGYGAAGGKPSEEGLSRDADAAYDLASRLGYAPGQIVLYGESLGAAVAVDLAARRQVAGLVLDAPFSSLVDVAADRYPLFPVRLLLKDPFRSDLKIGRIKVPTLILHGENDGVVPIRYGRRLASRGGPNVTFHAVPDADHVVLSDQEARGFAIAWLSRSLGGPAR